MKHTNANLYSNAISVNTSIAEFKTTNPTAKITKFSIGKTGRNAEYAVVIDWED